MNNSGVSQSNSGMITVSYPWHDNSKNNVLIVDCNFVNNTAYHTPAIIIKLNLLISQIENPCFIISSCSFEMNSNFSVLNMPHFAVADMLNKMVVSITSPPLFKKLFEYFNSRYFNSTILIVAAITVTNSVFIQTGSGTDRTVIDCHNVALNLNGSLVFKNFNSKTDSIITVESN